jgi:flagellar motility protein MotE (MotC chaperone)
MLTTGEEKLFKVKSEEQLTYSKVRMEIQDNEKDLLNAVTEQTNKLLSDLDQNWSKLSNSIEDEDRRVKDTLKTLLEQTDQTNDLLV